MLKSKHEFAIEKRTNKLTPACRDCERQRSRLKYHKYKLAYLATSRRYKENNKEQIASTCANWYLANKDYVDARNRLYDQNHKIQKVENCRVYSKERRRTDLNYRLTKVLRSRLRLALRNIQKSGSAISDLGCSIDELKQYIEKQFHNNPITSENMSWDNRGPMKPNYWQIDHIRPLVSFDLSDREQLKIAVHFSNLQPLWFEDHLPKSQLERR